MKNLFLIFVFILVLFSCSVDEPVSRVAEDCFITKSGLSIHSFENCFVSDTEIEAYARFRALATKNEDLIVSEVIPISFEDVICAYLLNYNEGWEVISGDKRFEPSLADSHTGSYIFGVSEGSDAWIYSLVEEIFAQQNKMSEPGFIDGLSSKAKESIENNLSFWSIITSPETFFDSPKTKVNGDGGILVLVDVEIDTLYYSQINHILETQWTQFEPFNAQYPNDSTLIEGKLFASDEAVAAAQMLYFLHNEFGSPENIPSYVTCDYINNVWHIYNHGSTDSLWSSMLNSDGVSASILIAVTDADLAATCVQSQHPYFNADNANIVSQVFNNYDITCIESTYNPSSIDNYLHAGFPSIVRSLAYSQSGNTTNVAYIVDACMHGIIRQTYYYELQYPDGTVGIAPIEQFYLGTVLWKFGMNFGTGNQSASWYSPTAIIELGDIYTISNASKTMISSFTVSD